MAVTSHYDVVVLGAGPGGYVAAIRAAQLGLSTAIIEQKYWGGVCLNVGCIPSKALLRNAELAHLFTKEAKTFGMSGDVSFDFGAAYDRSRKVADGRVKGVHFLMKKNKITEIDGWGTLTSPRSMEVALNDGKTQQLEFDNLVLANGSSGHGVMHAPALGQLLAEHILDGRAHPIDIDERRIMRFARPISRSTNSGSCAPTSASTPCNRELTTAVGTPQSVTRRQGPCPSAVENRETPFWAVHASQ